ncbi:MAG: FHA domain-containing protein [Bacteroidia bacterium]|nr:FHA domain-containing protein [Methylotenera sp.]
MAKLILSLENTLLSEWALDKERISIGRRPNNDIHIDNLAVSGLHAAIVKTGNDFYVEDQGSTNGTQVNAKLVKSHLLQDGDLIEFGKYQIKYVNEALANDGGNDFEKTIMLRPATMRAMQQKPLDTSTSADSSSYDTQLIDDLSTAAVSPAPEPVKFVPKIEPEMNLAVGKIQVLNGTNSGRELLLNKALTTLGKPGVQVAVITKRPNGYFITHVEGQVFPMVNGGSTGAQAFALSDHDVIELAGVKMEFYLN